MTPEMEEKLIETMGRIEGKLEDFSSVKKDVAKLKNDFSNLKGKLVVVAGFITFAINTVWQMIKSAF